MTGANDGEPVDHKVKRACEGYCGGYVRLSEVRVTSDGERFCPDCYDRLQNRDETGGAVDA